MKVELYYIAECPNHRKASEMLREILREYGFPDEVFEIEVTDSAQAQALAFIGSPSIRIEEKDIEPTVPNESHYGLSCRTYLVGGMLAGVPPPDMIRAAIRAAVSIAHKRSER
jgi:hypothetical protein